MPLLEFRILGPFEVVRDGASVPIGRRRERALLAVLLLSANRVVPVDRLGEELAADGGPPANPAALRVYVSRLRSALRAAGAPEALATHPGGYELRLDPEALDAARFDRLVATARGRLATGDAASALQDLDAALALWRGPALFEYQDAAWAQAVAARLTETWLAAAEDRFEALLGTGAHREVIGELEAFTREHPLRERCWALRMHALYRDGRQAEALAAFGVLRSMLRDELGLEPSALVRDLELAMLRHDPVLDLPARAGEPALPDVPSVLDPRAGLPARLATLPDIGFVGRDTELALLARAFKDADAGGGHRLLVLQGEPGMGKTTLCAELARRVHADGALVLYGRSEEELGIPYQPFAEALGHAVAHADPELLAEHAAEHGGELVALVPALRRLLPEIPAPLDVDLDSRRHLLFRTVTALLAALSRGRPVLLVLDDLHWADRATLLLLRHLAGTADPMRLLLVGTYRATDLSADLADTLAALRRDGRDRLELPGLSDVDVHALVESAAGHVLDAALIDLSDRLCRETGGNPFFLVELMRHLEEQGVVRRDSAGRWTLVADAAGRGMPASLREVVGRRVARLGAQAERLLARAAVLGRDFELSTLVALSGESEDEIVEHLDAASAAGIVVDAAAGTYTFVHAAIQSTLYDSLPPTRRALIHRQVAETLAALDSAQVRVAEIAHHWLSAPRAPQDPRAREQARRAGRAALAARAPEDAVRWFSAALDLLDSSADPRLRVELSIDLGTAQRLAGFPEHRETLLAAGELAASIDDADLMVAAALANNRGTISSTGYVDAERVAALQAALAVSPDPTPERALLLATLGAELSSNGDWPARREIARQAVEVARALGEGETMARVHNLLYFCLHTPETLAERLESTEETVRLAGDSPDPVQRHWAHRTRYYACADAGRLGDMDRHLPALVEAAEASGDPGLIWSGQFNLGCRALLAGRLDEAEARFDAAYAVGTAGAMPDAGFVHLGGLTAIRTLQDRGTEILPSYEALVSAANLGFLRAQLALLYCEVGRIEAARSLFAVEAREGFDSFPYDFSWSYGLTTCAEVCTRLGDVDAAAVLYRMLAPWPDQLIYMYFDHRGAVALYLGMLARTLHRFDDAQRHLAHAMDIHRGLAAPAWIARTYLESGRLLARPGGHEGQAKAELDAASAMAVEHGFAMLARQSAQLRDALAH